MTKDPFRKWIDLLGPTGLLLGWISGLAVVASAVAFNASTAGSNFWISGPRLEAVVFLLAGAFAGVVAVLTCAFLRVRLAIQSLLLLGAAVLVAITVFYLVT